MYVLFCKRIYYNFYNDRYLESVLVNQDLYMYITKQSIGKSARQIIMKSMYEYIFWHKQELLIRTK